MKMYKPTSHVYFAGGGLLDIGLTQAGVNITKSLEIEPKWCETLRLNFKHKIECADITKVTVLDQAASDIMAFTYPCNKYTEYADLHGTRTGDELFLHALRHIALRLPEMYVIENVPGMKKYPVVMEAMSKLPGYYVNVFCPLDAANWLPQSRERLILIGTRKPFNIQAPVKTRPVKLKSIIGSEPGFIITKGVINRLNGVYRDKPIISNPATDDIAPTCLAHYHKDKSTRLVVDKTHPLGVRPYTVREYARLQGVPDWYKFAGTDNDAYQQIGNGVAVAVGKWIGEQAVRYFN